MVHFYQKERIMRYRQREETTKSKKIVVNITPSDHQFLKILAADNNISMAQLVIRALRHYLNDVIQSETKMESE